MHVAGEKLVLLAEKVAYWPAGEDALRGGLPPRQGGELPQRRHPAAFGTTSDNVERLGAAIDTPAQQVVFLGDFLHSAEGRAASTLARFRLVAANRGEAVWLTLVRGNHDRKAGDPPEGWTMRCIEAGERLGTFVLNHEPGAEPRRLCARGAHPSGGAPLRRASRLRLPCFWFGARCGVLPAFGAFTGSAEVRPVAATRSSWSPRKRC